MNGLLQDVRYALRQLRKSPGFTVVAVLALALGIASTTAIFSVVNVVLLHPLPYPESDRIVSIAETARSNGALWFDSSPANYQDWAAQNHAFSVMAAGRGWQCNLAGGDRPERIRATMTTVSFFPLFGAGPLLGRSLLAEDEQPGHGHVVVLSHGL
jgi:putative ABC transport system permease protein